MGLELPRRCPKIGLDRGGYEHGQEGVVLVKASWIRSASWEG